MATVKTLVLGEEGKNLFGVKGDRLQGNAVAPWQKTTKTGRERSSTGKA